MVSRRGGRGASATQWVDDVGATPAHRTIGRTIKAAKGRGEAPGQSVSRRGAGG